MQNTKAQLIKIGEKAANDFCNAIKKAETSQRGILITLAEKFAGNVEQANAVLEGYQQGFTQQYGENTAKVRKSELNAVFKACAASEVSQYNLAKLKEFKGTYHAFISLARELQPKKASSGEKVHREKRTFKLTEKQEQQVEKLLESASPAQVSELVETGLRTMQKNASPSIAGKQSFILVTSTMSQILEGDFDKYVKEQAKKILEVAQTTLDRLNKAENETTSAVNAVKNNIPMQAVA